MNAYSAESPVSNYFYNFTTSKKIYQLAKDNIMIYKSYSHNNNNNNNNNNKC